MAPHERQLSRRRVLQLTGGTAGLVVGGAGTATADLREDEYCAQTTLGTGMAHYDDSMHDVCRDDHPESQALQEEVRTALDQQYPTVGALIDDGFFPYLDFFDDGSWSHFINPEYIGDDSMMNPTRPESILVDHKYWRPIGVMFIATVDGDPVEHPPSVYTDEETGRKCTPWHAHVGLPGRTSWWKYQKVYGDGLKFPCRTPWMMHVWIYPHSKSIYAHSGPAERGGAPAEPAGFETTADTNLEELGPEHLPDAIMSKAGEMKSVSRWFGSGLF